MPRRRTSLLPTLPSPPPKIAGVITESEGDGRGLEQARSSAGAPATETDALLPTLPSPPPKIAGVITESEGGGRGLEQACSSAGAPAPPLPIIPGSAVGDGGRSCAAAPTTTSSTPGALSSAAATPAPAAVHPNPFKGRGAASGEGLCASSFQDSSISCEQYWILDLDDGDGGKGRCRLCDAPHNHILNTHDYQLHTHCTAPEDDHCTCTETAAPLHRGNCQAETGMRDWGMGNGE